jgi:hypothetical protein
MSMTDFHTKILFNHEKYLGDETLFCIGGFQDLNTMINLKNNKQVTICHLLKSLPASSGMSRPQLFQQAEPNIATMVTIVTFLGQDYELVIAWQAALETEIRQVLALGEEHKVFVDPEERIWFGIANKSKQGRVNIWPTQIEHLWHMCHI